MTQEDVGPGPSLKDETDPIFVLTGDYASYTDFWRLVDLSGFRTVPHQSVDLGQASTTYIFPTLDQNMMACLEGCLRGLRKARIVFWNLERPDANLRPGMDVNETYRRATDEIFVWVDEIWVSDRLVHSMDPRPKFVVLGGHPDLIKPAAAAAAAVKSKSKNDIVHIGQVTDRRREILRRLKPYCLVKEAVSYGPERAAALSSSRLMIGIDRVDGLHFSASLRWIVAAALRLPMLQEEVADPYPLVNNESIIMVPYEHLVDTAKRVIDLNPAGDLAKIGEAAYDTYCRKWTFRRGIEEALR